VQSKTHVIKDNHLQYNISNVYFVS